MAHTLGRLGTFEVDPGAGFVAVGGITSLSVPNSHETVDETDFDSAGAKESGYGETQYTVSLTYLYDAADAGQDELRAKNLAKGLVVCRYRPAVGAGLDEFAFNAKINSVSRSNERNADVEQAVEMESSGTVTVTAQV